MRQVNAKNLDDPILDHAHHDYTPLELGWTVGEALDMLRQQQIAEKIVYFYVTDSEGVLAGVVPTRRLLMSQPDELIASIMVDRVAAIPSDATVLTACEFFIQYRFLAFPIVDEERNLVGVIDVNLFTDEVFSMAEKRSAEHVFQLIGVHVALGRQVSPLLSFRDRLPWLFCNIIGGVICALLAGRYEAFLDHVIVLALFIPVVLTLSESVSIQSMTLTLNWLQQERINWKVLMRNLRRELTTAALLGLACGNVVGGVALIWKRQPMVSFAISSSITLAMISACLLGILVPAGIRHFRGDPRIAAGPIALATTDVATLLFYFTVASALLK